MKKTTKQIKLKLKPERKKEIKQSSGILTRRKYLAKIVERIKGFVQGQKYRRNNLPNSIRAIHNFLEEKKIVCSKKSGDGRTNSCLDEDTICDLLMKSPFKKRLYKPSARHWFDIAIKDYQHGWLPINIKSTTTKTADNVGNLTTCVYALTDYKINDIKKSQRNGVMSKVLVERLKNKQYNQGDKQDYYFLVINKTNGRIITNSLKGLTKITPNINNLPFQVKWMDNKKFKYKPIEDCVSMVLDAFTKPRPNWKEKFLQEIRNIE